MGLWKQILGEHGQNLLHTRTQEKGAVTPQETEPDVPVTDCPGGLSGGVGEQRPAVGSEALNTQVPA